jgi:WD repeat-containing protein 70
VPQTHEVTLTGHSRSVQAMAINRDGSKMVTGSTDYNMKMWDFQTMNRKLKPFKDFKPFDGHPVRSLSFSPNGEHFLCVCGNN